MTSPTAEAAEKLRELRGKIRRLNPDDPAVTFVSAIVNVLDVTHKWEEEAQVAVLPLISFEKACNDILSAIQTGLANGT